MRSLDEALLITAGITVAYQLFFFLFACINKFDKVTDLAGGTNFIVVALFTFGRYAGQTASNRQIACTVLVTVWGLRLSSFLFYRILRFESDNRFDGMRENPLRFLMFWIMQMIWVWLVSLPVTFVNSSDAEHNINSADFAGYALAVVGLVAEAWADQSKLSFKLAGHSALSSSPNIITSEHKANRWCTTGLWKWSRHPNYFGEIIFWWGIFISSSQSFSDGTKSGYFIIISPVFITFLLLLLSGIPILERNANNRYKNDEDYLKYRNETSILIPLPNGLYRNLPHILKVLFLCEWPMYAEGLGKPQDSPV